MASPDQDEEATNSELGQMEVFASTLTANELGNLLAEYVAESNHSSWEGYDQVSDLPSIAALFKDLQTYYYAAIKDRPDQFKTPGWSGSHFFTKPAG